MSPMTKNPMMLAVLAAAALALGACGSSGDNASGDSAGKKDDKAYEGALKYAKCMRDNGIDMPDPQKASGGGIMQRMGSGKGEPLNKAKVDAADAKCKQFRQDGGGDRESRGADTETRDALLAYSKCMRANGVPGFPDPKFSDHGAELTIKSRDGSVDLNPKAPAFKAAEKKCQPLMAKLQGAGPQKTQKGDG